MKKNLILALIFILLLTACGGAKSDAGKEYDRNARELPLSIKLALGTLGLEKTDQSIEPGQAAELLPFWQVFKSLSSSDSAAQAEIDAILEQIQETMTSEQLAAIEDMELTYASAKPYFAGDKQKPEGDAPDKKQGSRKESDLGEKEMSPEQIATAKASRGKDGDPTAQLLEPLVQAVIELLESKAQ